MPKKKKPSVSKILLGVLATSVLWVILVFIPAGIQIYEFLGGSVAMLDEYPAWVWFAPLVMYIIYVAGRTIYLYRKELDKYNSLKTISRKGEAKSNKAEKDSIAMQDVKNSPVNSYNTTKTNIAGDGSASMQDVNIKDSFNTSVSYVPPEYYRPELLQLSYHLGIEIQEFQKVFQSISQFSSQSKYKDFYEAKKTLDKTIENRRPQLRMILDDNSEIIELLDTLKFDVALFESNLSSIEFASYERSNWMKTSEKPPQELVDAINKHGYELWGEGKLHDQIGKIVYRLVYLLRHEGKVND